ncbi:MAG: transglutaminase family protein [Desulfobacteraceae bacterium]|nr:transglutaminase family protein [Desulfobacteraceae bacterium]
MDEYLNPTYYIESDNEKIITFAREACKDLETDMEKAIALYYSVRDGIRYNPYSIEAAKESMKATVILERGYGYCVAKAIVLISLARSRKIPARLGLADVRNHLNTKRLEELMGTDLFVDHGYVEFFLEDKWVKATPAFNLQLCQNFNVKPLEFDGKTDSIFHEFDIKGNRHMEYVKDYGPFADLPWDRMVKRAKQTYPNYFENLERFSKNFAKEALQENQ